MGEFINIVGQRILQASGCPQWGLYSFLAGAAFNVVFDPILIFGYLGFPALGIRGAAIATVCGQAVGGITALLVCTVGKKGVPIQFSDLKPSEDMKEIIKTGAPAALALAISAVMSFGMNQILKSSVCAVAVFAAYYKLWSFSVMPVNGIAQSLIPVIGYNYSAKSKERVDEAIKLAIRYVLIISAVFAVVFFSLAPILMSWFDNGENGTEFITMGTAALRIISFSVILAGVSRIASNVFQGFGSGIPSMVYALLSQCIILLPAAALLLNLGGIGVVWWAFWIAEGIAAIAVLLLYRKYYRKYMGNQ